MIFWKRRKCDIKRIPVTTYWEEKFPFLKKKEDEPLKRIPYSEKPQERMARLKKEEVKVITEEHNDFDEQVKPKEKFTLTIDREKTFFRKRELTENDIWYLKQKDFIEISAVGVTSKKQDSYFILPRSNESPIHFFLCKVIEEFLLDFTSDVRLYETKKPDVVFSAGGKKFAVEVETGTRPSRNPVGFEGKVRELNKRFGERWFFVVTDRKLRKEYSKWGKTLVRGEVAGQILAIFETAKKPQRKGQDIQIQPKKT